MHTKYMRLKTQLDRMGYILSKKREGFLITDLRGVPVHETEMCAHSQTIDDVEFWLNELRE